MLRNAIAAILALGLLGAKSEQEPPMAFAVVRLSQPACEPSCPEWIAAEGQIMTGTAAKFARFLSNPAYRKLPVVLNSGGGKIYDAMAMGRLIRKYNMNTAIGWTSFKTCSPFDKAKSVCKPDAATNAYQGWAGPFGAGCYSACPLILLGGLLRVIDPAARVGLHQPLAEQRPYIDRYWETYRMVRGKKKIISRKFIKRIFLPAKKVVGVTPQLRKKLLPYVKELGGAPAILDEMEKAAPADMNMIAFGDRKRQNLGLSTADDIDLAVFTSAKHCTELAKPAGNCIFVKENAPPVLPPYERGNM
jgi:hypothetical protein